MQPVASGFTDAGGEWTYSTLVPADPALAEAPIHYQALIEPAGAPALLSDAVHLRLLGSRAYVLCAGSSYPTSSPTNGELSIVSLVRNERVAAVEFGYLGAWQPQRDSVPVFDASFSRGAVVPLPDELVFFDPFFGRVTERQALIAASQRIFASTDGERMFVLDGAATSTRIRVIEIATGDTLRSIALPAVAFGREWLVDPVREIAYVAGASSGVLAPFVERVDLAAGVDLGPVIVGAPLSPGITAMARSGDVVLVATDGSPLASASLARILETGAAPSVDIAPNLGNTSQIDRKSVV